MVSLMMSHDVIKLNFHTMSLPIFLDIGSCPEKLQIILKIYIKSMVRSWPLKLFTVVLGATTNVQIKFQALGVQKFFGHMTMQPLYSGNSG